MKYIVLIGDGMSDFPVKELGGKTPLAAANKPVLDRLAGMSEVGLVRTTPYGMEPGSDTAHLCLLGYDPSIYYTGRSPLEAAGLGIDIKDTDAVFRCNLVTLKETNHYPQYEMLDHSAGKITTQEAAVLLKAVEDTFKNSSFKFYPGVSYRHLFVMQGGSPSLILTPPHDILDKPIENFLPKGEGSEKIAEIMRESYDILSCHEININRVSQGLHPANSLWFWGQGTKPALESFPDKYGVHGTVISAVPLVNGIGRSIGLKAAKVDGATGELDTNYEGKVKAALSALEHQDFALVHLEAADECGHSGLIDDKVRAIELLDSRVLSLLILALDKTGEDYRLLVMPDHSTPLSLRTHSAEPVPYLIYDSRKPFKKGASAYTEEDAAKGEYIEKGETLMGRFLQKP